MGARATLGAALFDLVSQREDIFVLSADLVTSSGLARLQKTFPNRCINVGIAEQNLIGIASGMAKEGAVVFVTSFAPFVTMRACEQIRMNMGYMKMNVKAVGLGSGLAMAHLGTSHYGLEDISIMRSIPNITVLCPSDGAEIFKCVFAASEHEGPVYIRLSGGVNNPVVFDSDFNFMIGKAIKFKNGNDAVFFTNGMMLSQCLIAAEILEGRGISVAVIDMHTVKPLDTGAIDEAITAGLSLITVEEHSVIGGLGSAVAEYKSGLKDAPPHLIIGLPDAYGKSGEHTYLLEEYGLNAESIACRVEKFLKK
jgi:transketolase